MRSDSITIGRRRRGRRRQLKRRFLPFARHQPVAHIRHSSFAVQSPAPQLVPELGFIHLLDVLHGCVYGQKCGVVNGLGHVW
jgi:hypothetical protein